MKTVDSAACLQVVKYTYTGFEINACPLARGKLIKPPGASYFSG